MSERIRWDDKTPGSGDAYNVAHIGYAGTIDPPAFIIYTPDVLHDDWLMSVRLVPGSTFLYADTPDKLKAEAEKWLERFVSSLGAVFPDQYAGRSENEGGTAVQIQPGAENAAREGNS